MANQYSYTRNPTASSLIEQFSPKADYNFSMVEKVLPIFDRIARQGDQAVTTYANLFGQPEQESYEVPVEEWHKLAAGVQGNLQSAIRLAVANVEAFHDTQHRYEAPSHPQWGIKVWRRPVPIRRVGIHLDGRRADLGALIALATPANLAGCNEIILSVAPDERGKLPSALACAALASGVDRIFLLAGMTGIAALSVGTQTIPQVDKLFVVGQADELAPAAAVAHLRGTHVEFPVTDPLFAVIVDQTAAPDHVAAEVLAALVDEPRQQVLLLATSDDVVSQILDQMEQQAEAFGDDGAHGGRLHACSVPSFDRALLLVNAVGPSELWLALDDAAYAARSVQHASSVYVGSSSYRSVSRYTTGTNAVVPGQGLSMRYSGVSLDSFVRKITFQEVRSEGLQQLSTAAQLLARAERREAGLAAALRHHNS